ncbi:polysaccharide biosynthesis/export family protein [Rhodopirellula halodulae]|uniref:polysaccharide biosynthesis/export family protein n=1 Tax=Rhodopirellula halodulae TaxID=2894198 RepID=UPI001E5D1AB0|nr:polysaccharide biosynthesis/export family protein [Rhodopirellula sp. JC737]MCC9656915.1 polysaccharide biosynthesis/export family protein [Rhodopirellula sp. JC737]
MNPSRVRSAIRRSLLAAGLLLPWAGGISVSAQELVSPGKATPEANSRPTPLGGNTQTLPSPSLNMDDLPDNPPEIDPDELLEVNSLRDYRRRLEEHNLRTERAKLEARARFESRSRDRIPGLPSPQVNDSAEETATPATPPSQPAETKAPSTPPATRSELPPPLRPRTSPSNETAPPRPQRLGGSDASSDDEVPTFRPVPNQQRSSRANSSASKQDDNAKRLQALMDEDRSVESSSDLEALRAPVLPEPKLDRLPKQDQLKSQANKQNRETDSKTEQDPKTPSKKTDRQPASRSIVETEAPKGRSKHDQQPSSSPTTPAWPQMVQREVERWPLPASFASHGGARFSGHPSSVTCSSCGGCVDRNGRGLEQINSHIGIGTGTRPACQCWRCPQSMPFNLYGPGNYVGPARSAPLHEYRLRAGDQVQLTFLIKTVRSVGAYRLVVGDELLIESEADEKLTRGTLERGLEIQPDGTLTLRFIGQIHAAGQTIDQLRDLLNERYEEYYPDPSIDVTPVATGNVARQIREAISGSEGFNPQQTVQTITPEGTIRLPRLGAVPAQGLTLSELKREIILRYDSMSAGLDVEVVLEQQAPHYVYVLGEVAAPGRFEIDAPTTVLGGMALAGSYVPGANLRQVVIFRRGPNWELLSTMLDLRGALLAKQSHPADEIWLQDGDVVIVPPSPIRLFDRFVSQVFTEGIYGIVPFTGFGFSFDEGN